MILKASLISVPDITSISLFYTQNARNRRGWVSRFESPASRTKWADMIINQCWSGGPQFGSTAGQGEGKQCDHCGKTHARGL